MFKRKKYQSRLLYNYIISYLLVFLVPFIIMSGIVYYNSVSSLRGEIEQSNIYKLKQVERIVNERTEELQTIAARMAYDPRLVPSLMKHPYYGSEGIEELKKYKANSAVIEDLFIYHHAENTIYSTNGSHSIDTFFGKRYLFNNWDQENIVEDLHTKRPIIRPSEQVTINDEIEGRIIAYLFPIGPNDPSPYGSIGFFMRETAITDLMENILGEFTGNTYILNENQEVIVKNVNDPDSNDVKLDTLLNEKDVSTVSIDGREYSLMSVSSDVNGWTFLSMMDTKQFFERVNNIKAIMIITVLIVSLLGVILAVWVGRNQYKPIYNLFKMTNRRQGESSGENRNELDEIGQVITDVFQDQQLLNEELYMQRPFVRDQLLVKLLKGNIEDDHEIDKMLQTSDTKMVDGNYFVAIVHLRNITFQEDLFERLDNLSVEELQVTVYGVDLLHSDMLALIIGMEDVQRAKVASRSIIVEVQAQITDHIQIKPTIGVGEIYQTKSKINRSYIEALSAIEYNVINPQGSIIHFGDLHFKSNQAVGYPSEEQMKLVQSLKQGDDIVANETLNTIFTMLKARDHSLQLSKSICFDMINTIVKTASELEVHIDADDLNHVIDFTSIEQLHQQLQKLVLKISEEIESKKASHNVELKDALLAYIQKNYHLNELSLESMASKFNVSISYLSRFIKEQIGMTFTQYVEDLRMESAKQMLRETDYPIKQIVVEIGYKDASNFTRKFRKIVGTTPGQYRKLNR